VNNSRTVPAKVVGEPSLPSGLLRSVVRYFNPRKVILFGSRARGEADENSDIDLLVLLDDDAPPEHFTARAAHEARGGFKRAVDIVTSRISTFERRAAVVGTAAHHVAQEGRTVYERRSG
jgi:uncharacterized protein